MMTRAQRLKKSASNARKLAAKHKKKAKNMTMLALVLAVVVFFKDQVFGMFKKNTSNVETAND